MSTFTTRAALPESVTGLARRFEGADHDAPISFFLSHVQPGDGPKLHRHPYTEIFVVNEGVSRFTVGDDECRAWSISRATPAQLAAGEIHSDIQRGFIRAEVVAYDALMARGTMQACREHGEVRLEGKEYIVQDGDIINFRHAT